jgi:hypothetical protein
MTKTTKQHLKKTITTRAIDRGAWKALVFAAQIHGAITCALDGDLATSLVQAAEVSR